MNWYYVDNGQQAGPVDDAQLEALRGSGKLQPDTLIWSEGMANWAPYAQVKGSPAAAAAPIPVAPAASAIPAAAPLGMAAATPANEAVCAECGGVFNVQDTIAYGGVRVCARCKPIFMQKLAEGAKISPGAMVYAGFWARFAALIIDHILVTVVVWGVMFVLFFMLGAVMAASGGARSGPTGAVVVVWFVLLVVMMLLVVGYEVVMVGKYGATLGKMALGIKVVTADGGRVTYLRALGRYFAKIISGIILYIGFIMAAFDDEKRALHDRICDTRVVMK